MNIEQASISSRWSLQNNTMLAVGMAITVVATLSVQAQFTAPGRERSMLGVLLTAFAALAGVALTVVIKKRNAHLMKRTLKLEYNAAEFAVRKALSKNNYYSQRHFEEDSQTHRFDFSGQGLTLSVSPYDLINGVVLGRDSASRRVLVDSMGTLVTINGLSPSNRAFAERLARAIDEVVEG